MALTPEVRASQFFVNSVTGGATPATQVSQFSVMAVANFPTEQIDVSQMVTTAVTGGATPAVEVSQAYVTAVVRGRVDNHRVRAWTYSMDGHDFYVLQLGETGTLVFDMTTGQWAQWKSPERLMWRACFGTNWTGIGAGALTSGGQRANVVAGDDAYGLLWFVHPTQGYDEHPVDQTEQAFDRIVTGAVPMRMRETIRCNEIYLLSSKGISELETATQTVSLRTTDDDENTWTEQGTITITAGEYDAEFAWRSLGVIGSPGRIFEITDNCLPRVDSLDMR